MTTEESAASLPSLDEYAHASQPCDVVLKGGVTSGLVYPLALCALARDYRFYGIGGTSAGAIAAAATAAAEYCRRRGSPPGQGFVRLAGIPEEMGGGDGVRSRLEALFAPDPPTRRLFSLLRPMISPEGSKGARVVAAIFTTFWQWSILAAGLLLGLSTSVFGSPSDLAGWFAWSLAALLAAIVYVVVAAVHLCATAVSALPRNHFGITRGYTVASGSSAPSLTAWAHVLLQETAGLPIDRPLTFGDLEHARDPSTNLGIQLRMMTTCLTLGRPFRLPFKTDDFNPFTWFYFDPHEFSLFFPEYVVQWMVQSPARRMSPRIGKYCALPDAQALPVVVAMRMSLSFPLLISAVRLYRVDPSALKGRSPDQGGLSEELLEPCWFSDGGICSNFPLGLFDQPIPAWPTFGVNLRPFHDHRVRRGDEAAILYQREDAFTRAERGDLENEDSREAARIMELWNRFEERRPGRGESQGSAELLRFIKAIFGTAQGWVDAERMSRRGSRDTVAHVCLSDDEGGLIIRMSPMQIASLASRGRLAGERLRERFTDPQANTAWEEHLLYRAVTALTAATRVFGQLTPDRVDRLSRIFGSELVRQASSSGTWKDGVNDAKAIVEELKRLRPLS